MTNVFITSVAGTLVAEVNNEKRYELCDAIYDLGLGFNDSIDVDYDLDEHNDIWGLIDALYEKMA